jgi:hypothetical protein
MKISRRIALELVGAAFASRPGGAQPTDAKFGIWAHWGPTSAIGTGDWYARNMYMEGSRQYQ